ncbi:MAG: serine hydrolase domain-containing protein [Bacillota bacterium]|nr:serine hydrolase domain-containing protein [Bacillota bacterium]
MRRLISAFLCITLIFIPITLFAEEGSSKPISLANLGIKSIQYAVIDSGKIESEYNTSSLFPVGSVSKVFTAASVMLLSKKSLIDLDKPVTEYLPEFKMADERYKDITVRMLLNHTSGLYGSTMKNSMLFYEYDSYYHDNILKELEIQTLKSKPGEMASYCNDGYTLAELIIEKVSGMSYSDFIKQNLLTPANLNLTTTADKVSGMKDVVSALGAGGVYSNASELCKFGYEFTYAGKLFESSVKNSMASPEYLKGVSPKGDSLLKFGLGWDNVELYPFSGYNIKALSKGGDTLYYHSCLIVIPKYNMAAAVMTEGGSSIYCQMIASEYLLSLLKEKGIIENTNYSGSFKIPDKEINISELKKYNGIYLSNAQNIKVTINDSSLVMDEVYTGVSQTLKYLGGGVFGNNVMHVSFREDDGETYLLQEIYAQVPGLGKYSICEYGAQKKEPVQLAKAVEDAWTERNGLIYLLLDEKYSSEVYAKSLPAANVLLASQSPGYVGYLKIIDENTAKADIKIPGLSGRDLTDYVFFNEDGAEYLKAEGRLFLSINSIPNIYSGEASKCTILSSGYSRWFKISKEIAGKNITVNIQKGSMFTLYDENGKTVKSSVLSGENTAVLPKGGYIVFSASPGYVFDISVK